MTPIVSHTVNDVPAVPNALTPKNVGFRNTHGGAPPMGVPLFQILPIEE
jgi:hypothetical protein